MALTNDILRQIIPPFINRGIQTLLPSLNPPRQPAPISQTTSGGIPFLNNLFSNQTTTGLPRSFEQVGGIASLLAGLTDQPTFDIPDFADFATPGGEAATGFLQEQFESPFDPFVPGGVFESQLPLLLRQEAGLQEKTQEALVAGRPVSLSTAMGGTEIAALQELGERFLQNRQAFIGNLLNQNVDRQIGAATSLADIESRGQTRGFDAALAAGLSSAESERDRNNRLQQLGIALLTGGRSGGQGGPIFGTDGASLPSPQALFGGDPFASTGQLNPQQLAAQLGTTVGSPIFQIAQALGVANTTGNAAQLTSLLASGQFAGQAFPFGINASTPAGQAIQQAISAGLVESPAAIPLNLPISAAGGQGGGGTFGISGTAGAVGATTAAANLGALGGAAIGTGAAAVAASAAMIAGPAFVGFQIGQQFAGGSGTSATRAKGAASGAAGGAAIGFALGGPPGAVVGAIIGGIAGLFGSSKAEAARKQADIDQQTAATEEARPFVLNTADELVDASQEIQADFQQIFEPALALAQQGNTQILALAQQAGFKPTADGVSEWLKSINTRAQDNISALGPTAPEFNQSGSRTLRGLVLSWEEGKFVPGVESIVNRVNQLQGYGQAFAQVRALLGL